MMTLLPGLDQAFDAKIRRYGAENAMPYLTTIERFAQLRTARENILEVLGVRFGELPFELGERLERVGDAAQLKYLLRQSILISSIAAFQALLANE